MKTIGLVGGLTWHSTLDYYRHINQLTNERLGGDSSARILLYSVDFSEIKRMTFTADWDGIAALISDAAVRLQQAGADCMLLGANTMHRVSGQVQQALGIPLIHIADATAQAIQAQHMQKVALLGTRYTMEMDFYHQQLKKNGVEAIIPDEADRQLVHDAIYQEMGKGIFTEATRMTYNRIIEELVAQGAQGVIMGCTEIPLLLKQEEVAVPLFDTAFLHAKAAVDFALA
ncbi:MAG: aspartate/glutamate racemase family protein [Chitinophagaceae bacterium]|jgi:aspartate racemase|nr:aspartate/glutamate racemase family protein [Chitinophagaceae bacterium]